jgi:hypothetical protein
MKLGEGVLYDGAEVKPAGESGLGVFATRRLIAGHVLLMERPLVFGMLPKFSNYCCRWCLNVDLSRADPLEEKCAMCSLRWCSKACRSEDARHDDRCAVEARLVALRPRLAAAKTPQEEVAFLEAVSLLACLDEEFEFACGKEKTAVDASLVRELSGRNLSDERVEKLAGMESCNSMSITNQTPMGALSVGRAIFRLGSRFNHSCWPNVCRVRNGSVMKFVVVRPVNKGDELCISYVPPRLANKVKSSVCLKIRIHSH